MALVGSLVGRPQAERKSKRHTGAQLIHRLAVYQRMAQADIEGEIVTYLQMTPTSAENVCS